MGRADAKAGIHESGGQLPRAVSAEVHEHHRVAIDDRRAFAVFAGDHRGGDELVVLAARIRCRQRRGRIQCAVLGVRVDDRIPGAMQPVPALVAVHRVVAPSDAGDVRIAQRVAGRLQRGETGGGGFRRHVTTVEERMHRNPRHPGALGKIQHREDVALVAVHATGRQQSQYMQGAATGDGRRARGEQFGIGEKAAVVDRGIDPGQVLVDDAAGAEVHVPDFGIAHLPVRQADMAAGGFDQRVRLRRPQRAPVRQLGLRQRVVLRIVAMTPAIEDQQDHGFRGLAGCMHDEWPRDFGQMRIVAKRRRMPGRTGKTFRLRLHQP